MYVCLCVSIHKLTTGDILSCRNRIGIDSNALKLFETVFFCCFHFLSLKFVAVVVVVFPGYWLSIIDINSINLFSLLLLNLEKKSCTKPSINSFIYNSSYKEKVGTLFIYFLFHQTHLKC